MGRNLKAIDFFCGAGGMTRGLLDAGVDVVAGVDNHLPCKKSYEYEGNNTRPDGSRASFIHADINTITYEFLANATGISRNDDRLVFCGCSPCQYWSKINTSKTKASATKALLHVFSQLVDEFRPGYVVVENVPGLKARSEEAGLASFQDFLSTEGYGQNSAVVFAYQYGVPQKRRRFLLVATRIASSGRKPSICLPPSECAEKPYPSEMSTRAFIGEAHGFLRIEAGHRDRTPFMHTASGLSPENLKRIRMTPRNGGDRSAWRDDVELQIPAYLGRDEYFRDVYGRMKWEEPAPTITTRFISLSNGRFGHPEEDRAISLREGATLQTFPKSYVFDGVDAEIARQVGNAVPPELARRIGEHLLRHWRANGPGQN
ncbi:MAG: DNA cytosine methyltransferase [Proteobacteria bacterium]|nr:DNA cytosine methyltransferase [Pseudomonadota bacterium]